MDHDAIKQLASIGLIKDKDLAKTSTGAIKGILPGHHIQGYQLAQSDPYLWVQKNLLPAMQAHGITKKQDQLAMISQVFSNRMAAQLAGIFATQGQRIEKDMALLEKAKGPEETARILQAKDPSTQIAGLKNAAGDVVGTLGQELVTNTGALNAVTDALGKFNEGLTNPKLISPGQEKFNRFMDKIFPPGAPIVPGSGQAKFNRGMNALFPPSVPVAPGGASAPRPEASPTRQGAIMPRHHGGIRSISVKRSAPSATRWRGSLRQSRDSMLAGRRRCLVHTRGKDTFWPAALVRLSVLRRNSGARRRSGTVSRLRLILASLRKKSATKRTLAATCAAIPGSRCHHDDHSRKDHHRP
jgi:hypothetical protein